MGTPMKRLRVLYLDKPFEHEKGGDKNRSRFIWKTLKENFDADLLLLDHPSDPILPHLVPQRPPFPRPSAIPAFSAFDREVFLKMLRARAHDVIFSRFCTGWELCDLASRKLPDIGTVIDVDMLSSRLADLSWRSDPVFHRRWFLHEAIKLKLFEKKLFRKPWQFLFSNPVELQEVRIKSGHPGPNFYLVPNVMPEPSPQSDRPQKKIVLFFGSLDSSANSDAAAHLLESVLPLIESDLKSAGAVVHIVGKNPPEKIRRRIETRPQTCLKLIGEVDSIESAISECLFVLLPLRIASGTRTRILEAAAQKRAVVTTTLGAEGLDLGDGVLLGDDPEAIAIHVRRLLLQPQLAAEQGRKIHGIAASKYSSSAVASELIDVIRRSVIR